MAMIILGIDPGTARVGWAIVDPQHIKRESVSYGCLTTEKLESPEKRLKNIYEDILRIIDTYTPDCLSVENLFFSTNVKTAIAVGEARGVILLAAGIRGIPVYSYSPNVVKQTICGSGKADKKQVQYMIKQIIKLTEVPKPDDTADALALALTHAYSYKLKDKTL
jgi:crossover junction endodeoxyribonuclease RuvC